MPTLGLPHDPVLPAWPDAGTVGILDLEYTAWDGSWQRGWSGEDEWREIVQLGFLVVDGAGFRPSGAAFEALVRPSMNPVLSGYFTRLTGIDQERLDRAGMPLAEAVAQIAAITPPDVIVFNGNDGEILQENCRLNRLSMPWQGVPMFNFRPLLAQTLGLPPKQLVSSDLPAVAGLVAAGRAHTALDDCRAIASAFAAWRQRGVL